ncbi:MAG: T9SS type A sorting domain-containing protein [Lentimicrobium sp.]|nr:T9SS type A sorting domain-containing protein [Lentimicrobium sp.]
MFLLFKVETNPLNQPYSIDYYPVTLASTGHFSLNILIAAKLAEYRFSYSFDGNNWILLADHVVCGDVILISGQSNASAESDKEQETLMNMRYGNDESNIYGKYSRTFTRWHINPNTAWSNAQVSGGYGVGVWGLRLQYELQKANHVPTCLINGAVGGTGMDQHQLLESNPFYFDFVNNQYLMGSLLTRVYYAGLENDISAIIWYNGEDECGSPNPETGIYTREFDGLYQSCVDYLGSFRKMYVVQVASYTGPRVGIGYVSEDQRNLPLYYENLNVMSSNGIGPKNPAPGQHIHFLAEAYAELGRRLFNLIQKDIYGQASHLNPLPPAILKVRSEGKRIYLDFDQLLDVSLSDALENVLSVISFNQPGIPKYNPRIKENSFYFEVDTISLSLIQEVSYAGFLPNGQYDLKCYLRNSDTVAALSFYKMPLSQGGNPYGLPMAEAPQLHLQFFPNPVKDIARISWLEEAEETCVQLFNPSGCLIMQQFISDKHFDLDCTFFPPGFYFLRISNKYGSASRKFCVGN